MDDPVGRQYMAALLRAADVHRLFTHEKGRPPVAEEIAIAAELFKAGASAPKGEAPKETSYEDAWVPDACPDCGGPLWDNRADKQAGKVSKKYPDFKCKDRTCDKPIWLDKKKRST